LQRCLTEVVKLTASGVFKPTVGKVFEASAIAAAHEYLEKRKSMGKVAIQW
jgi:NADPH2:quinone reductase